MSRNGPDDVMKRTPRRKEHEEVHYHRVALCTRQPGASWSRRHRPPAPPSERSVAQATPQRQTALHASAPSEPADVVSARRVAGRMALHRKALSAWFAGARLLLAVAADVLSVGDSDLTCIHVPTSTKLSSSRAIGVVVSVFLDAGAVTGARETRHRRVLHCVAESSHRTIGSTLQSDPPPHHAGTWRARANTSCTRHPLRRCCCRLPRRHRRRRRLRPSGARRGRFPPSPTPVDAYSASCCPGGGISPRHLPTGSGNGVSRGGERGSEGARARPRRPAPSRRGRHRWTARRLTQPPSLPHAMQPPARRAPSRARRVRTPVCASGTATAVMSVSAPTSTAACGVSAAAVVDDRFAATVDCRRRGGGGGRARPRRRRRSQTGGAAATAVLPHQPPPPSAAAP